MRTPLIKATDALRERMVAKFQVPTTAPEAEMPPYMESFLAHLRLLVGVPFGYLVPDSRLLPPESIRFFDLDRSWTDRLVDGAVAVGKIGTREQAHHQAHEPGLRQQLDQTERIVRALQQGGSFAALRRPATQGMPPAEVITGFLLRSYLVTGWPQMDVRAYSQVIQEHFDRSASQVVALQLKTLRLEVLSPSIMIALFQGMPQMVTLDQPHHGIQFGLVPKNDPEKFKLGLRDAHGGQLTPAANNQINVPMRGGARRVVDIASLWKGITNSGAAGLAPQTGGGSFALQALDPPWSQHFEGTVDQGGMQGSGRFVPIRSVAIRISEAATQQNFKAVVTHVNS
jgi:hypothetical protein